jgi:hypothetical protein
MSLEVCSSKHRGLSVISHLLQMQRARLKDPEIGDYGVLPQSNLPKQDARSRFFPW